MNARQWARDLRMGAKFAFTGGREGWTRVLLTAVGVGLGVALLLLTTAIPDALSVRHQRDEARSDYTYSQKVRPRPTTPSSSPTSTPITRTRRSAAGWWSRKGRGPRFPLGSARTRRSATWSSPPR